jgi:hypothetical protein
LQCEIHSIAQLGVALANADAEGLDAEQLADHLELGIVLLESLQDVEAAGQRIDATLRQRQPGAVVVLEGGDLGLRRRSDDVLLQRRALLDGNFLAVEVLQAVTLLSVDTISDWPPV